MPKRAKRVVLGKTEPHGAQELLLLEDCPDPGNRIYAVRDSFQTFKTVEMTGEELAGLSAMWAKERLRRRGGDEAAPDLASFVHEDDTKSMRAAGFMEVAKGSAHPFAGNRFADRAAAFEFLSGLLAEKARVLVAGVLDEPDRIRDEGGPYADTLYVDVTACEVPEDVVAAMKAEDPDEMDELASGVFRLWWD